MGSWIADVKVSVRQLQKTPVFTIASVVVLALGIGLNAAMFGVIYAFTFMGRPYAAPERMVQLYSSQTKRPDSYRAFSYPAYQQLAAEGDVFAGVLAQSFTLVGVSEGGEARRTSAALISHNYFDVLGVPLFRGRGFTAEEDRPGQNIPVVVATYAYWQRTGFNPALIGSNLRINERAYTVVGITPRGFTGTMMVFGPELFFPLGVFHSISDDFEGEERRLLGQADTYSLFLAARLADGVSIEAANVRLGAAGPQLARAFPAEYEDARMTVSPLPRFGISTAPTNESALGTLGGVLLGLTGVVLLTVCLNLASMLMARGRARRKEFAIRLALGGGRGRIVRQLLTEGLLLSLAGGTAGVMLGLFAIDALIDAFASALPISIVLEGAFSPALIGATLFFSVLATLWFALGPALRHSRADLLTDLKPQAGDDVPDRRRRLMPRHPLLIAQVSLSLALLIAAGLFVRMVQLAFSADFGFRADSTVLAEVDSRLGGYNTAQSLDLFAGIERRLAALPGVEVASIGALVPMGMVSDNESIRRAGINVPADMRPQTPEEGRAFDVPWNAVSGGYFAAMGVSLLQGRTFNDAESFIEGRSRVAVIDDALARKLWPTGNALGQHVEFVDRDDNSAKPGTMEVVGVVASTRRDLFEDEPRGAVYVPFAQGARGNAYFHVRPQSPQDTLPEVVRREIKGAAPSLPLFSTRTYASHISSSVGYWALQLTAALFAAFGGLAMLVALIGIYGVMSYAVARRTREIGIRIAVGAMPGTVRRMILSEGLAVTLAGVAIGWVLGIGVGRVLDSIFVDFEAFDGVVFAAIPVSFVAAALLAVWVPARRATRVDPMHALRSE